MSLHQDSATVSAARAHIDAWSKHDWDASRAGLAEDVWVTATAADPNFPRTDLRGADAYMTGLIEFAQAVVPGSVELLSTIGHDTIALVSLTVRVKFGPDAPEMMLPGSRMYVFDENGKIKIEHLVFFVAPQ
ncbi:MAG TPA: nuclear transport factor 2 family protein [Gaiellaceae bacterium]|nr:nuclear transport factor 2 family protein [Gaiellaceae bacterium]